MYFTLKKKESIFLGHNSFRSEKNINYSATVRLNLAGEFRVVAEAANPAVRQCDLGLH